MTERRVTPITEPTAIPAIAPPPTLEDREDVIEGEGVVTRP